MEPRWINNPRYQKAVLKMSRLDPTRKAILDTVMADEVFADQEMRTRLQMMNLAAQKKANERNLSLNEKRLGYTKDRADARYDVAQDRLDIAKDDTDLAEKLGWANLAVSGLQGYGDLKAKQRKAKQFQGLASLFRSK